MRASSYPRLRRLRGASAILLVAISAGACSAAPASGPTQTQAAVTQRPPGEATQAPAPPAGTWTGTITLHGVIAIDKTEDGSDGDPGSTYYDTYTKHDVTQTDVTDTYTITASDPEDLTYGIDSIDLGGSAANAGTTLERYTTTWKKQNSGCTWTEEDGTETKGPWTGTGKAVGSVGFNEDGSYSIDIHPDISLPNGEEPDGPQLPYRNFQTITDLSAGCQGTGYDQTTTQGPIVWWVSSFLGETDVNNIYSNIEGNLNPANPGSTVDGSSTWKLKLPEMTMTITWHLVHSGQIVLPHS